MSITKSRLKQIIKEEVDRVNEGYGSSGYGGRGGRYRGGDTTGYKGSYNDTPWYRAGGSGRMSDAEAREMGARGYDEPNEPDYERGPRGGLVHSTVSIYIDPEQAADRFNANLGSRLDKSADVFLGMSGYDGMVGNLIVGKDMQTGFNKIGPRWVLGKGAGGYTFTIEGVVGNGATPSEALADAAQQGFQGSDVVLGALGGGMGGGLEESRWRKLAGISESATRGQLREFRFPWEDEPMYEQTPFTRYLESAAATLKRNMISRGGGKDGFDEDYLRVVVGPSSDPRTGYTGRTGESYGDMILRVYFERGDFPVVGGVYSTKEELVAAGTVALAQAAGAMSASAPTVKDATVIQVGGRDPDFGSTYGWQMTLNPPVTK